MEKKFNEILSRYSFLSAQNWISSITKNKNDEKEIRTHLHIKSAYNIFSLVHIILLNIIF